MAARQFLRNLSCFIVGYTGECGKELTQAVIEDKHFSRIILGGRRIVPLANSQSPENKDRVEQIIVDFEKLCNNDKEAKEEFANKLSGIDVIYCCLGTTRNKAGKDGFIRVDHDYIMAVMQLGKEAGVKEFHLVSSQGANRHSMFLYTQIKGQVEENLRNMRYNKAVVYRPAMLMCDREERRPMERVAQFLVTPISWVAPTAITTPVPTLIQAMLQATFQFEDSNFVLLNNADIFRLAKQSSASPPPSRATN